MKKIVTIAVVSALALGLAACNSPGERAAGGALIGGATGAAIGGLATGRGSGALVGGLIGAGTGAVIGASTAPEPGVSCYRDRYGRRICEEVY
jgi:osmotically inducible lipoprotein OsmB